jgi:hypothetical protein
MSEQQTEPKPVERMTVQDLKEELRGYEIATGGLNKKELVVLVEEARHQQPDDAALHGEEPDEVVVEPTAEEYEHEHVDATGGAVSEELAVAEEQALALREQAIAPQHALPGAGEFNAIMAIADRLAHSRIVPSAYQGKPDNIVAAVMMGRELGIGPMQSLKDISVIEDKPALAASLQLGLLRKRGLVVLESSVDDERAWIKARRSDTGEIAEVEWTYAEAQRVKDRKGGILADKANWRNYRRDMLWARCVGRLTRRLGSDLVAGMVYTAEEVADFDTDWGSEYGSPQAERPVYRQNAPAVPVPQSWAEVMERLRRFGSDEEMGWQDWIDTAARRKFGKPIKELPEDVRKATGAFGQLVKRFVVRLDEQHSPDMIPPLSQQDIIEVWAFVLDGEVLDKDASPEGAETGESRKGSPGGDEQEAGPQAATPGGAAEEHPGPASDRPLIEPGAGDDDIEFGA